MCESKEMLMTLNSCTSWKSEAAEGNYSRGLVEKELSWTLPLPATQLSLRPLAPKPKNTTFLSLIIEESPSFSQFQLISFFQQLPENMAQYQPSTAKISLWNPLTEPLEKCAIVVAGRGLIYRQRKYR